MGDDRDESARLDRASACRRVGEERWEYKVTAGRVAPFVEARIVGADGEVLPCDGSATGELEVRGPWIAAGYYNDPDGSRDRFDGGWLRTGDIASLDADGYIRISDRSKDVIKSGGEWISSVELENELIGHAAVREAAVISMPDERWSERPLACVALEDGAETSAGELRDHLASRVAKWWIPDAFAFIDEVPKTSVGKFDKKVLRSRLADGELDVVVVEKAAARRLLKCPESKFVAASRRLDARAATRFAAGTTSACLAKRASSHTRPATRETAPEFPTHNTDGSFRL